MREMHYYSERNDVGDMLMARKLVFRHVKRFLEMADKHLTFDLDEVYVIQFSRTLQHTKAWITTSLPDGVYYEVIHNGDKHETYINAFKRFESITISDEEATASEDSDGSSRRVHEGRT